VPGGAKSWSSFLTKHFVFTAARVIILQLSRQLLDCRFQFSHAMAFVWQLAALAFVASS
jgi:hypothetical protein